jgi:hypothetical protein
MSWSENGDDEVAAQTGVQEDIVADNEEQGIEMPDVKLFNKWTLSDVEVSDISLSVRFSINYF